MFPKGDKEFAKLLPGEEGDEGDEGVLVTSIFKGFVCNSLPSAFAVAELIVSVPVVFGFKK